MNSFKIDQPYFNRIQVEWIIEGRFINITEKPIVSPPFVLQSEGQLIPFSLIFHCYATHKLEVRRSDNTIPGTAIVTVIVKHRDNLRPFVEVKLTSNDRDTLSFNDIGTLPPRLDKRYMYSVASSKIKCYITWLGFTKNTHSSSQTQLHQPLCITKVPYTNKESPDVKLILDNKEITAHKAILSLHSPVFMKMFQTRMREAHEKKIIIEDVTFETMKILIGIIYTGEDDELVGKDMILKVLAAAHKYQMSIVMRVCEVKLLLEIPQDPKAIFSAANLYGTEELFRTAMEYIVATKKLPFAEIKEVCMKEPKWMSILIDLMYEKLEVIICTEQALSK
uniref:BTB domain-containing protein n=1 Tax=Bracon brevicornis TaxID=1563983 RepID=A0A6V7LH11_9HYME